jgi:hypothetical protein
VAISYTYAGGLPPITQCSALPRLHVINARQQKIVTVVDAALNTQPGRMNVQLAPSQTNFCDIYERPSRPIQPAAVDSVAYFIVRAPCVFRLDVEINTVACAVLINLLRCQVNVHAVRVAC